MVRRDPVDQIGLTGSSIVLEPGNEQYYAVEEAFGLIEMYGESGAGDEDKMEDVIKAAQDRVQGALPFPIVITAVTETFDGLGWVTTRSREYRNVGLRLRHKAFEDPAASPTPAVSTDVTVKYWPSSGGREVTFKPADYIVDHSMANDFRGSKIFIPNADDAVLDTRFDAPVTVTYSAGAGLTGDKKETVRQAIKFTIQWLWDRGALEGEGLPEDILEVLKYLRRP